MQEKLNFTVDSALLQELGEKLVETVHIALVELVKNSYDADASEVEILFTKDKKGRSEIHIIDNGKGMNFDSVQQYWMRIATTNKEKLPTSAIYGRPLTGAKGIGRFSCRRLGGKLTLITTGTDDGNAVGVQERVTNTTVVFPWLEFIPGTDVTEIECLGQVNNLNNTATGTTLIISEIVEEWNTSGWNWLKRQLAVLAANTGTQRSGFKNDPGFKVKITAPNFEGGIRDIRADYINAGWGTLKAHINKDNQAVCELEALGIGKKTITSSAKFPALKDITLELGIMVADRTQMRDTRLGWRTGSLSKFQSVPLW
jgi:anti-sigma regulatory factor (Ser/Thr protein kinase)